MLQGIDKKIVPLDKNHLEIVKKIHSTCFPEQQWKENDFLYFLNKGLCYGLFIKKELVSYFLGLLISGSLDIISIGTLPDFRKQGLAGLLMDYLYKTHSIDSTHLEVNPENNIAIEFYKKLGFQILGTRKKYYQGKHDAWVMGR